MLAFGTVSAATGQHVWSSNDAIYPKYRYIVFNIAILYRTIW